jgi:hypothetical protein
VGRKWATESPTIPAVRMAKRGGGHEESFKSKRAAVREAEENPVERTLIPLPDCVAYFEPI